MIVTGDCLALLPTLRDRCVDHGITDPPYSRHVHEAVRRGCTGYHESTGSTRAQFNRTRDLGFDHLSPEVRAAVARQLARVCRRWILVFTDHEGGQAWKDDLEAAGAEFVRFGIWVKVGAAPQFTGDRPASGHEVIVIAHAAREKGRLRWNGGGRHAVWTFPIVLDRGANGARVHDAKAPPPVRGPDPRLHRSGRVGDRPVRWIWNNRDRRPPTRTARDRDREGPRLCSTCPTTVR